MAAKLQLGDVELGFAWSAWTVFLINTLNGCLLSPIMSLL